ncbi:hypothetical protein LTR36_005143 [Oleoguttula mirabilis]|uniref:Uncharacterized protein n=1 Tax=Oleoguttula mirabilis TaxID=1507867 RepID=A0AAV9JXN9_9PEZI|nr:hypothetical protein LTR36_005143 [Oleoguttula mirabilis]
MTRQAEGQDNMLMHQIKIRLPRSRLALPGTLNIEVAHEDSKQRRMQVIPFHERRLEAEAQAQARDMATENFDTVDDDSSVVSSETMEEVHVRVRHPSTDDLTLHDASDADSERT